MIDQFPADTVGVEIFDHRRGRGFDNGAVPPKCDPIDPCEVIVSLQRGNHACYRCLSFTPNTDVDLRLLFENLTEVIGREDPAVDDH